MTDAEAARAAVANRIKDTSVEVASAGTAYANADADGAAKLGGQVV
ncbi:hypothetical protein [Mycobacterium kyorinense]|nr:hypothetical protein [Mycobacterium kyorinense]